MWIEQTVENTEIQFFKVIIELFKNEKKYKIFAFTVWFYIKL